MYSIHKQQNAKFETIRGNEVPIYYGEYSNVTPILDHPVLVDISYFGVIRIGGQSSIRFLETLTTGDVGKLEIGESLAALVLTAEAEIIDVVTIIKSGDFEFICLSTPECADELLDWMKSFSQISDSEGRVFEDTLVEDQSGNISVFSLFGEGSIEVLNESISMNSFESVVLVFGTDSLIENSTLVFMPNEIAPYLFNSLLSHLELELVGYNAYKTVLIDNKLNFEDIDSCEYQTPKDSNLMHLIRNTRDFVGGKNLDSLQ